MPRTNDAMIEETATLLDGLKKGQREYLLFRLVSEKLDETDSPDPVAVLRPDGTLLGYIRRVSPPSVEDQRTMSDRARSVNPNVGRPMRELLDRMRADDAPRREDVHQRITSQQ